MSGGRASGGEQTGDEDEGRGGDRQGGSGPGGEVERRISYKHWKLCFPKVNDVIELFWVLFLLLFSLLSAASRSHRLLP